MQNVIFLHILALVFDLKKRRLYCKSNALYEIIPQTKGR